MAFNPSKPEQQDTDFRYLVAAVVLTLGFVVIAIATTYTTYINWQQHTVLNAQHQQQHLEQLQWHKLDRAYTLAAEENYQGCVQVLSEISADSDFYPRAQRLSERCYAPLAQAWLSKAEQLAAAGHLKKAITTASQISGGPLQAPAQQQIRNWSQRILDLAKQDYYAPTDEFLEALAKLRAIPDNSPLDTISRSLLDQWQREWADNRHYEREARIALDAGDLIKASQMARQISQHPAWANRREQLLQDIAKTEQSYEQIVQQIDQFLIQGKLHSAERFSQKLPDTEPWTGKKLEVFEQIKTAKAQKPWRPIALSIATTIFAGGVLKHIFLP
ncbi:MAG: hypothetical protein AAGF01_01990 [Cyanobacteria bacterium P01_G01_bin.38]